MILEPAHKIVSLATNFALKSLTMAFFIESKHPFISVIFNWTLSKGKLLNCWVGFWELLKIPLLKSQFQEIAFIEESWKTTSIGTQLFKSV